MMRGCGLSHRDFSRSNPSALLYSSRVRQQASLTLGIAVRVVRYRSAGTGIVNQAETVASPRSALRLVGFKSL